MQYLLTERAHLMCPHMCFGIAMAVSRPYDVSLIRACVERLSAAHPFLRALLGCDQERNAYFYRVTDQPKTALTLQDRETDRIDSPEVMSAYRQLTGRDWNLFEEGMLKITAWPMGESTCFLLVFHHLLADGRGALGLARELAEDYALGRSPRFAEEKLITAADLPEDSRLPFLSRLLVSRANRAWAAEGQKVSYQAYHAFADAFLQTDAVTFSVTRLDREELNRLVEQCRQHRVTVNDYLLAKMMTEERTGKVIAACDLRDRLTCCRQGALGNYSTAFSVEASASTADPFALARAVHQQVQKKMKRPAALYLVLQCYASLDPGLLDAALISCRGGFSSKAGRFIGSRFFGFRAATGCSVTNLGRIESDCISSGFFLPPASPAMRTTWGALTVNGVLTVCACER